MATGNRTQIWRCAVVETPTHHGVDRAVIWKLPGPNGAKFESAWRWGVYCGRSTEDDAHMCATRQGMVESTVASLDEGSAVEPEGGAGQRRR